MRYPLILLGLCSFLTTVHGKVVRHTFVIQYSSGWPDGVFKPNILTINGQFPGPTIQAEVGDSIEIDVVKLIQDGQNVSIHWHGLYQKGTPFNDGASMVTQCPLKAGHVQRYRFTANPSGTHWYHSHVRSQYTEGLWGAIIVHSPEDTLSGVEDIVITLNDWYHLPAKVIESWYLSPVSEGYPPYPNSALMNGMGRYPCPFAQKEGRLCSPNLQKRPVFHVIPNKSYRLRIINTSAHTTFNFTVVGQTLWAVAVDGVELSRLIETQSVLISVGQRYDFLLREMGGMPPSSDYLIRADVWKDFTALNGNITGGGNINEYPEAWMGDVTGILRYSDKFTDAVFSEVHPYTTEVPTFNHTHFLDVGTLTPASGPAPSSIDLEVHFEIGFIRNKTTGILYAYLNPDTPYVQPLKPVLHAAADGDELSPSVNPVFVDVGMVVQVVINNPTNRSHPLHLHGHHFWVVGQGETMIGDYAPGVDQLRLDGVKRDTSWINSNSWMVIRFLADNVGVWALHCHIDWHMIAGMMVTFVVGQETLVEMGVPEEAARMCELHHTT